MEQTLQKVLDGQAENHLFPFLWLHGEDEATLRHMMDAIEKAGCKAVCVESRPHPDFCGPQWWSDLDVILDEARMRGMKVWILDDSHFPTGYANGALNGKPDALCRQNIFLQEIICRGKSRPLTIDLQKAGLMRQKHNDLGLMQKIMSGNQPVRKFEDDSILSVTARCGDTCVDLTDKVKENILGWLKPQGDWTLSVITRSRNTGAHRSYINMTEESSCKVLLDAVYEPHWEHYKDDFGRTIAGFFSDEPELGNGKLYAKGNVLGTEQDLPWGTTMENEVAKALGPQWREQMYLLWRDGKKAQIVRSCYMDVLTKRVRTAFSKQISDWCHAHGVEYIGHMIEDDGQHCRTGSSLGHYFRGLQYQDMAGIDDIGGQVMPQGEDEPNLTNLRQPRNGEFYHYGLAKLAQSAAAIEPRKHGRAMCEIFGNYGWGEGVRLEKYLADHFLVRGINYFVPHAFTAKAFPDPDCPPHFYAQGHNPQYRHFGELMRYMNRVATLTSCARHEVPVAILYHGDMEWADGKAMPFEKPLRVLYDHQIDCHTVPADIFAESKFYNTKIGNPLTVNGQEYKVLVVPSCKSLPAAAVNGIKQLLQAGLPVLFVEPKPQTISETGSSLPACIKKAESVSLTDLYTQVSPLVPDAPVLTPANDRIRLLHICSRENMFFVVNEGTETYHGKLKLPVSGGGFFYDPWSNHCFAADFVNSGNDTEVALSLEPLHSVFIVSGDCPDAAGEAAENGSKTMLTVWKRSLCEGVAYPDSVDKKPVTLPDQLAEEKPKFSGFACYETMIPVKPGQSALLEISDAAEGVEVFLNGKSLGIQIVPPFRYPMVFTAAENHLTIEVATTLERQVYPQMDFFRKKMYGKPTGKSGLTGTVSLRINE